MTEANDNPYASPTAVEESVAVHVDPHRDGDYLVTPNRGQLPMRCYICNGPGELPYAVKATGWISWRGVVARVNVLAFVCRVHRSRLWVRRLVTPVMVVAVFLALGVSSAIAEELQLPGFVALLLFGLAIGAAVVANHYFDRWAGRPLRIARVQGNLISLSGGGEDYLANLDSTQPSTDESSENHRNS